MTVHEVQLTMSVGKAPKSRSAIATEGQATRFELLVPAAHDGQGEEARSAWNPELVWLRPWPSRLGLAIVGSREPKPLRERLA